MQRRRAIGRGCRVGHTNYLWFGMDLLVNKNDTLYHVLKSFSFSGLTRYVDCLDRNCGTTFNATKPITDLDVHAYDHRMNLWMYWLACNNIEEYGNYTICSDRELTEMANSEKKKPECNTESLYMNLTWADKEINEKCRKLLKSSECIDKRLRDKCGVEEANMRLASTTVVIQRSLNKYVNCLDKHCGEVYNISGKVTQKDISIFSERQALWNFWVPCNNIGAYLNYTKCSNEFFQKKEKDTSCKIESVAFNLDQKDKDINKKCESIHKSYECMDKHLRKKCGRELANLRLSIASNVVESFFDYKYSELEKDKGNGKKSKDFKEFKSCQQLIEFIDEKVLGGSGVTHSSVPGLGYTCMYLKSYVDCLDEQCQKPKGNLSDDESLAYAMRAAFWVYEYGCLHPDRETYVKDAKCTDPILGKKNCDNEAIIFDLNLSEKQINAKCKRLLKRSECLEEIVRKKCGEEAIKVYPKMVDAAIKNYIKYRNITKEEVEGGLEACRNMTEYVLILDNPYGAAMRNLQFIFGPWIIPIICLIYFQFE
ncbi:hypothetical protein DdX_11137 [Ditylenchus destructor]|uniref:Uncharacterized protein n=1 Tax=Ditylenchus destructor TaxID=166010 RepID=A0AAD4R4V1_9BILA|nr:hypothetical protein DdX_11137 [Ditylenchus destructor]